MMTTPAEAPRVEELVCADLAIMSTNLHSCGGGCDDPLTWAYEQALSTATILRRMIAERDAGVVERPVVAPLTMAEEAALMDGWTPDHADRHD